MSRPLNAHPKGCRCAWHEFLAMGSEERETRATRRMRTRARRRAVVTEAPMTPDDTGHFWVWRDS